MTIEELLKAKIVALATPAAERVYRDIIEQEPILPAIGLSRTGGAGSVRGANGVPLTEVARITIATVAWAMADAMATALALKAGLDGWTTQGSPPVAGTPTVLSCKLLSQLEQPEIDGDHTLRVVFQDFEIKFR